MASKSIAMHKHKQLILLYQRSAPIKQAVRQLEISRNTIRRYSRQLDAFGGPLSELLAQEEPALHAWFNPPPIPEVDLQRFDILSRISLRPKPPALTLRERQWRLSMRSQASYRREEYSWSFCFMVFRMDTRCLVVAGLR